MDAKDVKGVLLELLRGVELRVEHRCAGHMAPTKTYLEVWFAGEKVTEVQLAHEECPGEWG